MSSKKSLTEQAAFLFAGEIVVHLMGLLVPIILVRLFPVKEYGLYRQIFLIFVTLLPFGRIGVTHGLFYFLPREPERKNTILAHTFIFVIISGSCCLLFLLLFRSHIATWMNSPAIEHYIPLLAVYLFLMITSSFFETSMIAEGMAQRASLVRILSELSRCVAVISAAFLSRNISVILYALILFALFRCLVQWFYLRRFYQLSFRDVNLQAWRRHLGYTVPIGFENMAWMLQGKLHNYFVVFFFSTKIFAIYSIGAFNIPVVAIITSTVAKVMLPELSKCQKEGNTELVIQIWQNAMRKMNFFLFPIFVYFFIMSHDFIVALFTDKYVDSVPIFRIGLLAILTSGINTGAILNAYAQTRYQMNIGFARISAAIVVLYLFIKFWGVIGAISANVVVSAVFMAIVMGKITRVIGTPLKKIIAWRENGQLFFIALVSGIPILLLKISVPLVPIVSLAVTFFIYISCYVILSLCFNTLSVADIFSFIKKFPQRIKG